MRATVVTLTLFLVTTLLGACGSVSESSRTEAVARFDSKPREERERILARCYERQGWQIPDVWIGFGDWVPPEDSQARRACIYVDAGFYSNFADARAALHEELIERGIPDREYVQ